MKVNIYTICILNNSKKIDTLVLLRTLLESHSSTCISSMICQHTKDNRDVSESKLGSAQLGLALGCAFCEKSSTQLGLLCLPKSPAQLDLSWLARWLKNPPFFRKTKRGLFWQFLRYHPVIFLQLKKLKKFKSYKGLKSDQSILKNRYKIHKKL